MSYTYLITGATSDVGRALIERLLQNAPADTLVLAQGCGDLEKLADLCARFPSKVRPFDVDLSDRAKVDTFVQVLAASAPAPTHFIHLPALPVVNAKFKAFDQTRFDRDLEIQVHSAVRICRAVLPAMAKARAVPPLLRGPRRRAAVCRGGAGRRVRQRRRVHTGQHKAQAGHLGQRLGRGQQPQRRGVGIDERPARAFECRRRRLQ